MNEIIQADTDRIEQLLQQLRLRLPATQFQRVANFIRMDLLDPYTTLKDIGEHLKMQFPDLFREVPVTDESVTESHIRLKDLVMEITLNNIAPYTTQIAWEDSNMGYEFQFRDDTGNWISVFMADTAGYEDDPAYEVSFFVKNAKATSYTANKQVSSTTANYLRIMATVGAAIMDFIERHQPAFVEFTGADSDPKKAAQKTRLYTQFARDNAGKFTALGYRFVNNHMGSGLERVD
jgi:hypothetical protein